MRARREIVLLLLLAAAPLAALAPAWVEGRLLAPEAAARRDLPWRIEAWRALASGEIPSWNGSSFSGTPLLASYRPGALHPLMLALAPLPSEVAFQALVLVSLGLVGPLCYAYARRLGAGESGALVGALAFALGPYLVGHLGDTALLVAAPWLVLVLLALEAHLERDRWSSAAALAASSALLLLAGSPDAVGAAALLLTVRLGIEALARRAGALDAGRAGWRSALAPLVPGVLLAAPQLVPTLLALPLAGPAADPALETAPLVGIAGLVVRSVSHTPAPIFALAAVPLVPAWPGARAALAAVGCGLLFLAVWGRLDQGGPLACALELALAVTCALSFSRQWRERRERRGRRLRLLALIASLFCAAALSIATTIAGSLAPTLAAPVGLLALALILYFVLAESHNRVAARVFLLPLVVSFLMQPWGRQAWLDAPSAAQLRQGTATRAAIDRAMGPRQGERTLVLRTSPPTAEAAADLAWGNLATFAARHNANGEDPLVPGSRRAALDGMRSDGTLPRALLETDPGRLELLGIRWLQVPTSDLAAPAGDDGLGDAIDVVLEPPRAHLFALPLTRASEVRIVSFLAEATHVEQGAIVAECVARLANGPDIWLPIRAGVDTAEWAWDRDDVRARVRHGKPPVFRSATQPQGFAGHEYLGVLRLPGRFTVTALRFRAWPGAPPLRLLRAGLHDALTGRSVGISLASAYASDAVRLEQTADTPFVSLFEVRRGIGPAWVVPSLRVVADEERLLELLRAPTRLGVDARQQALATAADVRGVSLPSRGTGGPADLAAAAAGRLLVRAGGPGLLVVGEGWDPGWTASVDGRPARVLRVNADRLGVVLGDGLHRVALRHHARGFLPGCALALAGALLLAAGAWRGRRPV